MENLLGVLMELIVGFLNLIVEILGSAISDKDVLSVIVVVFIILVAIKTLFRKL